MEIIIALLAWAAVSPDPVSLRLSRGAAGAARGVVWGVLPPRLAHRLTVTGRILRKAHRGWVHGTRQAKMQRRQRKDTLCRVIRGVRRTAKVATRIGKRHAPALAAAGLAVLAGGKAAAGWVRNRLSGSNAAAPTTPFAIDNTPKNTAPNTTPPTDGAASTPAPLPVSDSPIGTPTTDLVKSEHPASHHENTSTEGEQDMSTTMTEVPTAPADELVNIAALNRRLSFHAEMLNMLCETIEMIRTEGAKLGDEYDATDWGTTEIDQAVAQISENLSTLQAPTEAVEAAASGINAVAAAAQIGETAAEHGARGRLEAFNNEAA